MKHHHIFNETVCGRLFLIFRSVVTVLCIVVTTALPAYANSAGEPGGGSVLNILFLGLIAYFLVRMFRRRSGGNDDNTRPGKWTSKDEGGQEQQGRPMDRHEAARQMWGHLSSDKPETVAPPSAPTSGGAFDEGEFLEGAKLFFTRFQQARDSREIDELRAFLSDEVYAEAAGRLQAAPLEAAPEVMLLNARLMEVKSVGDRTSATVFYDGQMRRGVSGDQSEQIRSVWEFSRDDKADNALWTLERINKVDQ